MPLAARAFPMAIEEVRHLALGDPGTGVRHGKANVAVRSLDANDDPALRGGELDRVADEVREYSDDLLAIAMNARKVVADLRFEADAFASASGAICSTASATMRANLGGLALDREAPGFDHRGLQQVLDEVIHRADVAQD